MAPAPMASGEMVPAPAQGEPEGLAAAPAEVPPESPPVAETQTAPVVAAAATPSMSTALLEEHNRVRARHCAAPLTWSPALAADAQRWARSLRDRGCAFEHSRSSHGENLAAGTSGTLDAAAVVGMWVEEQQDYDFARGGFSMGTGHFTQVVWRATTQLGCGMATCPGEGGMDIFVCNYEVAGNLEGAYRENVKPEGCR